MNFPGMITFDLNDNMSVVAEEVCPYCERPGHSRNTSHQCRRTVANFTQPEIQATPMPANNAIRPAESSLEQSERNVRRRTETSSEQIAAPSSEQITVLSPEQITIPSSEQTAVLNSDMTTAQAPRCRSCNRLGHQRTTHSDCLLNPRNPNNILSSIEVLENQRELDEEEEGLEQVAAVRLHNIARGRSNVPTERHYLGRMEVRCEYCHALLWLEEKLCRSSMRNPKFSLCCNQGDYTVEPLRPTLPLIRDLLIGSTPDCREFRSKIRFYNSKFNFTSLGVKRDHSMQGRGPYTFRIQGTIHHRIGSVFPWNDDDAEKAAQIYVVDSTRQINLRSENGNVLDPVVVASLQQLISEVNGYARDFVRMADYARSLESNGDLSGFHDLVMVFQAEGVPDARRYNAPTASEIGILFSGREGSVEKSRNIMVRTRREGTTIISEINQHYDPLHYVLIFPQGERGWCIDSTSPTPSAKDPTVFKKLTMLNFYSFRLMVREDDNMIHYFGSLFQQYATDMYVKIEQSRLKYLQHNQGSLRTELYNGLRDVVSLDDLDMSNVGRRVILPSSFIGGPRHMAELYQDALSIVRKMGKPDLFITFTCNPSWVEITESLGQNQHASDRPDLVARVFKMKLTALINDLTKNQVLGRVAGRVNVIEYQKRGLPHAHILIILVPEDRPQTVEDCDAIVSAELPDESEFPLAHATVKRCMVHGPCRDNNGNILPNSPCVVDNKCSKGYPKDYRDTTSFGENNSYPVYRRRRDDDNSFPGSHPNTTVNNKWIVPHNVYLCSKYDAHINVEICSSVSAVKYLYKYIYKGHDRAVVNISNAPGTTATAQANDTAEPVVRNEINEYVDARYVSASEAFWRIFSFSMHEEYPHIQRLALHLPDEQPVYFNDDDSVEAVLGRQRKDTTLTGWFLYNRNNAGSRGILYPDFPDLHVWNNSRKQWKIRERGFGGTIGRVYVVSPRQAEKFYLRLLLFHVPGATCFDDLKRVDNVVHETFQDAAMALGLLANDDEWDECLNEAVSFRLPVQLRRLFEVILLYCNPSNPFALWDKYKSHLSEDYTYRINNHATLSDTLDENDAFDMCLLDMSESLEQNGIRIFAMTGFIRPVEDKRSMLRPDDNFQNEPRVIREQLEYVEAASSLPDPNSFDFNPDQRVVFDSILRVVNDPIRDDPELDITPKLFFVDGPGGTGKTFVFNALLNAVRREGGIALSVASSGTAAILLDGGRTAHSRFKIPLNANETSVCNFSPSSAIAQLLRRTKLIIWDECSMIGRYTLEAVDRTFKDAFKNVNPVLSEVPFAGRVVVLGGDFRQVLPIVPRGTRSQIVDQCINRSVLWSSVQSFRLTTNMRVQQALTHHDDNLATRLQTFADFLLRVGSGTEPTVTPLGLIRIPNELYLPTNSPNDLSDWVFGNLSTAQQEDINRLDWLSTKAILTPLNKDVKKINNKLLDRFPGVVREFLSSDTVDEEEDNIAFPVEYINSIENGGFPDHSLKLKIGCPLILLRNLDPEKGLCNGTRLVCRSIRRSVIEVTIAAGAFANTHHLLPRINFIPTDMQSPVAFKRRQFPVRLGFCMTINKAQGQTLDRMGLYLPNSVFSHGQLYVGLSRVRSPSSVRIVTTDPHARVDGLDGIYTRNVVYNEIF